MIGDGGGKPVRFRISICFAASVWRTQRHTLKIIQSKSASKLKKNIKKAWKKKKLPACAI